MIKILLSTLLFASFGCSTENSLREKELELKQRELDIREKELSQKESAKQTTQQEKVKTVQSLKENSKSKKLRYVSFSNGGLIGYFDDGSIASCPRCDLIKENIKSLYTQKPSAKYKEENGVLIINGTDREYPTQLEDKSAYEGWAMVDYKWYVDL